MTPPPTVRQVNETRHLTRPAGWLLAQARYIPILAHPRLRENPVETEGLEPSTHGVSGPCREPAIPSRTSFTTLNRRVKSTHGDSAAKKLLPRVVITPVAGATNQPVSQADIGSAGDIG